jgi:predicted TPR repeat methyltransferase
MKTAVPDPRAELYARALALYERNDPEAAMLFERVLADDPANISARYKLANVRKDSGALDAAMAGYLEVLRLDSKHAEAMTNLGAVLQLRGDIAGAETFYRRAIETNPGLAEPAANLGRLLQSLGRIEEAAHVFSSALARGLDAGLFGHLLDAASGHSSARAPVSYVRETFDAFAAEFEQRLVGELKYEVPSRVAALVLGDAGRGQRPRLDILDLGCGTGLAGIALAAAAGSLVGVDLSPKMLVEARRKGCYTDLHEADILEWLVTAPHDRFDLVVAADVFIYVGELERVFHEVARVLRVTGKFAFSVETCVAARWRLLPTGRYAQSDDYVLELASRNRLRIGASKPVEIRRGVPGMLYLAEKCHATGSAQNA